MHGGSQAFVGDAGRDRGRPTGGPAVGWTNRREAPRGGVHRTAGGAGPAPARGGDGRPRVGVLALQGDVEEHRTALTRAGAEVRSVRTPGDLEGLEGLVLPGGESTAIGRMMERAGLLEPLRARAAAGNLALFGTCAGMILLAREVLGGAPPRLGVLDVTVERNAYGRQVDSFEVDLPVPALGEAPVRAVFIRAPVVRAVGPGVEVLATWRGHPVLVRQGRHLASAFHPELVDDLRLVRHFLTLATRAG